MKNYCVLETVELVGVGPNGESAYPVRDFFRGSFTSFNEKILALGQFFTQ